MKGKSKGFIKELSKPATKQAVDPRFNYPKAVVRPQEIQSQAVTARAKRQQAVKPDTTTSFVSEQTTALKKHKGEK